MCRLDGSLRSFLLVISLALLLTGCANLSCPAGQELLEGICVCSATLEPPIDGMCQANVCGPDGCPCTLEGIEGAIARGGAQVIKCGEGAAPVMATDTIVIDNDVTLDGQGNLTVRGNNTRLLFEVQPFEVGLTGLTITRGDQGLRVLANATVTLTNSVVEANTSTTFPGGGIRNDGRLTLVNTIVESNRAAVGSGGGIYNGPSGVLTLSESTVSDNEASVGPGGGIGNDEGSVEIDGSEVSENRTGSSLGKHGGGGVSSLDGTLVVADSIVRGNTSSGQGGGFSIVGGTALITRSEMSQNRSSLNSHGGGLHCTDARVTSTNSSWLANTSARSGGGLRAWGAEAELILRNSTVSGNEADPTNEANGVGGGVEAVGGASVTIINSTIYGNSAGTGKGGGLYIGGDSTMVVRSSTISGNAETGITNNHSLSLTQTIIDNSCELGASATVTSVGHNIESPQDTCGLDESGTDMVGVTPEALNLADRLADNGGDTWTLLPADISVAVDYFLGACDQPEDQRGVSRAQREGCDIGAVEVE